MCELKTVNIKGKEYVEVNERIKYFRSHPEFKNYSLESEVIFYDNGVITIKATIKDVNGRVVATGLAQEKESSSFINKTSFVENCETSAWGRALGNLGIGIDTSIASAEEVKNAINNQNKVKETSEDIDNQAVKELEAEQKYSCVKCGATISKKVADFSMSKFKSHYCMNCQKEVKAGA